VHPVSKASGFRLRQPERAVPFSCCLNRVVNTDTNFVRSIVLPCEFILGWPLLRLFLECVLLVLVEFSLNRIQA
jgi:hypothetical protein